MNKIIFRTCTRDDFICRLAYTSCKMAGVGDQFIFLCAKDDKFKHTSNLPDAIYTYHEEYGTFAGESGVEKLFAALKRIAPAADDDVIFIADSDILMLKSPLSYLDQIVWDHSGVGGPVNIGQPNYLLHFSGQCQILKGHIFNKLREQTTDYINQVLRNEMLPKNIFIADDTYLSLETDKMRISKVCLPSGRYWYHQKFYNLEQKFQTDYEAAVRFVLDNR
jgi:hypothetical protein